MVTAAACLLTTPTPRVPQVPRAPQVPRVPEGPDTPDAAALPRPRSRAAARLKGLRPGRPVIRRAKDLPGAPRSRPGDNGRDPRLLGDQIDSFVADRGGRRICRSAP